MKQICFLSLGAALLAGCTAVGTPDEMVTIIPPADGSELTQQCSRPSIEGVTDYFEPTPAEITGAESAAMRTLRAARAENAAYLDQGKGRATPFDWPEDPSLYRRQYVGYVAGGRRMIYGNFLPATSPPSPSAATIVCDGGPQFFGVEYDIESGAVTRIAFNGGLGGPMLPPIEP